MNKVKKVGISFLIFVLVLQYLPAVSFAEDSLDSSTLEQVEKESYYVASEEPGGLVSVYSDEFESNSLTSILDGTVVKVLNKGEEYTEVSYLDEATQETSEGYIKNDRLVVLPLTEESMDSSEPQEISEEETREETSLNVVGNGEEDSIFEQETISETEEANTEDSSETTKAEELVEKELNETSKEDESSEEVATVSKHEQSEVTEENQPIAFARASISTFAAEVSAVESITSKLGHIKSSNTKIYKSLDKGASTFTAGSTHTNTVYYIKKEATVDGVKYYLISKQPSYVNGVVGWVKETDISTHTHEGVDKETKTFYLKGNGSAYSKAWGGSKDLVYSNLSAYRYHEFKVNLTEKVGSNIWYRGTLNGKTVWVHSSYVTTKEESNTSRLGQIAHGNVDIYKNLHDLTSGIKAGTTYTNRVFYIKKQAVISGITYYLISTQPSSTSGVLGWVHSSGIKTYTHVGVDKKAKTFYMKGNGAAYSKAWGGSQDAVYTNLSSYRYNEFNVNLTEKVGNNTWYRGTLNGKTVWVHSGYVTTKEESNTSRLGQIAHGNVDIFKNLHDLTSGVKAGTTYTNRVFYIKKQAVISGITYYLISTQPSSTGGVLGWVHSSGIKTYAHVGVDNGAKTFYMKGNGVAYSKAWGGEQDIVYSNLSSHRYHEFKVNLTEKVGNNIWYRGTLGGKTAWVHSSYVTTKEETNISRLGQIAHGNVDIFKNLHDLTSGIKAGTTNTNKVYYIKKQAVLSGITYYLISTEPSSTSGVLGWVNASGLTSYTHVGVDKESKTFYTKGSGAAYSKAWGGSKDLVYNLSQYKDRAFNVNLTEKVGNNIWYRGTLNGKTVWIHEAYLYTQKYTNYGISLNDAVNIQMTASPQTDKEYKSYVSKEYISANGTVTATTLNVRGGPSTSYWVVGTLKQNDKVTILGETNGWYEIQYTQRYQWVNASPADVRYYLDPNNFVNDSRQQFQFLDLSKSSGVSVSVLNNYLKGKGTLAGQGQAFIDASRQHGINDIYLVSHAILETGNGTSTLAKGVKYNNVTVYNMYGIGAYDSCPIDCGAKRAYEEGWTTPYKAIVGGAAFIGNDYIKSGLNTLYKMRWNPEAMATTNKFGKQYATDIGWASKQVTTMYNLYQQIGSYSLFLDIPVYK